MNPQPDGETWFGDRSVGEVLAWLGGRMSYRQFDWMVRNHQITLEVDGNGPGSTRRVSNAEALALRDVLEQKEACDATLETIRIGELFADRLDHYHRLERLSSGPGDPADEYADTTRPLRIVQ